MTFPLPTSEFKGIGELIMCAASVYSSSCAISDGTRAINFSQLQSLVFKTGQMLAMAGCIVDEPVIVEIQGTAADLIGFLAVWNCGAVCVPLHKGSTAQTARNIRARSSARFVLGSDLIWNELEPEASWTSTTVNEYLSLWTTGAELTPCDELRGAAFVVFTSGTTGQPKGVIQTHQAYLGRLQAIDQMYGGPSAMTSLIYLPLSFSFGQWTALYTLAKGGCVNLRSKFDPVEALRLLGSSDICWMPAVPSMLRRLAGEAKSGQRGPELFLMGGETLREEDYRRAKSAFSGSLFTDVYGLTETNSADFVVLPRDMEAAVGSIGGPSLGVDYRIRQVGSIEDCISGELQIKTPFRMAGYMGQPELTAAVFEDGYLRTGDLVERRSDGRLQLTGRLKELINRGGNKISPVEVEAALALHPLVAAVVVGALPSDDTGEAIGALVVPTTIGSLDEGSLKAWLDGRLESYKIPDKVRLVDAIPLTANGKLSRSLVSSYFHTVAERQP